MSVLVSNKKSKKPFPGEGGNNPPHGAHLSKATSEAHSWQKQPTFSQPVEEPHPKRCSKGQRPLSRLPRARGAAPSLVPSTRASQASKRSHKRLKPAGHLRTGLLWSCLGAEWAPTRTSSPRACERWVPGCHPNSSGWKHRARATSQPPPGSQNPWGSPPSSRPYSKPGKATPEGRTGLISKDLGAEADSTSVSLGGCPGVE